METQKELVNGLDTGRLYWSVKRIRFSGITLPEDSIGARKSFNVLHKKCILNVMGIVYVVSTPIGNLSDISERALNTLKEVEYIFCEDTRVSRKLLNHYGIDTDLISYHSYSGFGKISKAIEYIKSGKDIALISDAGTPSISDPGVKFTRAIREKIEGVEIKSIPGPSALTAALSISGAPASSFLFLGFLPRKKGKEKIIQEIGSEDRTVVFFESPHRIIKTLGLIKDVIDKNREVIVVREMTKIYESVISGTADSVLDYFLNNKKEVRGEFVVVVSSLTR